MKYLKNTGFKPPRILPKSFWLPITNPAYSKAVQKLLFKFDYGWAGNEQYVSYTDKKLLLVQDKHIYFHGDETYEQMLKDDTPWVVKQHSLPVLDLQKLQTLLLN